MTRRCLWRRGILAAVLPVLALAPQPAAGQVSATSETESIAVSPRTSGAEKFNVPIRTSGSSRIWLDYAGHDQRRNLNVPYVASAGYKRGAALPAYTSASSGVVNVRTACGLTTDGTDNTTRMSDCIAARTSTTSPTIFYFPSGTYTFARALFLSRNNIHLLGDGSTTVLRFPQPLRSRYGSNIGPTGASQWAWSGGNVWITPSSRNSDAALRTAAATGSGYRDDWSTSGVSWVKVTAGQQRGDETVTVADPGAFAKNDLVYLRFRNSLALQKRLAGPTSTYAWDCAARDHVLLSTRDCAGGQRNFFVKVFQVSAVDPVARKISFTVPHRFGFQSSSTSGSGDDAYLGRVPSASYVRDVGLSRLKIQLARPIDHAWSPSRHHQELGYNGAFFNNCFNCYARDVTVQGGETFFNLTASQNVTLSRISMEAISTSDRQAHHGVVIRQNSSDNLVKTVRTGGDRAPILFHGLNVEYWSAGNVYSDAVVAYGTLDTHRRNPYENVYTNVTLQRNNDNIGGNAGPSHGVRSTAWNVRVHGWYDTGTPTTPGARGLCAGVTPLGSMPLGTVVEIRGCDLQSTATNGAVYENVNPTTTSPSMTAGAALTPRDLYDAQYQLRTGAPSPLK